MLVIMFIFVLGSVDFLMAMYQWNAAAKAVQIGARIAAVSDPVASDVNAITGLEGGAIPGTVPPPAFMHQDLQRQQRNAAVAAHTALQR